MNDVEEVLLRSFIEKLDSWSGMLLSILSVDDLYHDRPLGKERHSCDVPVHVETARSATSEIIRGFCSAAMMHQSVSLCIPRALQLQPAGQSFEILTGMRVGVL